MPSCRERARRLTRRFKPKFVQQVPQVAVAQQQRAGFTWSPIR